MGYYVDMIKDKFYIKKENEQKVIDAIKEAVANGRIHSWVIKKDVEKSDNLQDTFLACRWDIEKLTNNHGYGNLYFDGEKLGDDYEFFRTIAPYVEDDSYIEMRGEDGDMWRWVFEKGECKEIYPTIIW